MAATIASLLTDFSSPAGGEPQGIELLRSVKIAPVAEPEPALPVVDRQAELIRSLEARVRAEEREIARKELEDAIAAEKTRHEEDMNVQREIWVEQQAMQMATQIVETLGRIETMISERTANVLKPFVLEAFRQKSLDELKGVLETLLYGGEAKLIRIAGPEDLLAAMRTHLGSHEGSVEFSPGGHVEVSVAAQDTMIQTRLNSWSSRLAQVLEG
jgi:hypothetical protein